MPDYNKDLQDNNSKINNHNIDIQDILDAANALPTFPDTVEQATPTITVDNTGKITATATQEEGFVEGGTKSATHQLTTQAAKTVTPNKSVQTVVEAGRYTTGDIKVGAISDEYIIPSGTKNIDSNGTHDVTEYKNVNVAVEPPPPNLQSKTASPTTSQQVITPDSNYDGLDKVTIAAMPSGTAGTPTATKGTPSNHTVTVTPKVTNAAGYITGGTKTGTGVTVSASELVSGTLSVTENGTHDVTNYASVNVDVAGSGGGGSVETCTVIIADNDSGALSFAYLSVYQDGIFTTIKTPTLAEYYSYRVDNVICGSVIAIEAISGMPASVISTSNMSLVALSNGMVICQSPSTNVEGIFKIEG